MTYGEIFAVTDLLSDVRQGKEIKPHHNTKIDLASVEDYFKNLLTHIDKTKTKSNADVIYFKLRVEVKK